MWRQPKGLKGLVLTNPLPSYALWVQSTIQLLQGLPPWVMEGITAGYGNKEKLLLALKELYAQHGCLLRPQPEDSHGRPRTMLTTSIATVVLLSSQALETTTESTGTYSAR